MENDCFPRTLKFEMIIVENLNNVIDYDFGAFKSHVH
jgi:hypothetical protein